MTVISFTAKPRRENKMSNKLAEDIIIEILSRLPVKSLLRFKCVCKEWHEIIDSPTFITKHLNGKTNYPRLLVQYLPSNLEKELFSLSLFFDKDLNGTPPLHEDIHKKLGIAQMFGPVNGLFFLHIDLSRDKRHPENRLALWNPATRQLRHLPYPKFTVLPHCYVDYHTFGFGYDCLSNDYKVVWVRQYYDDEIDYLGAVDATSYSLSKDSWTSPVEIECFPLNSLCATFLNGAYYWVSSVENDFIMSFDFATETFRDIQGPSVIDYWHSLLLYDDYLALLVTDYSVCSEIYVLDNVFYYMWIMKEEGCWIKLLTIGPCQGWGPARGVWNNNEILIQDVYGQLLLYNPNTHTVKDLGLQSLDSYYFTYIYKESLVSVKGESENWQAFESLEESSKPPNHLPNEDGNYCLCSCICSCEDLKYRQ